MDVGLSLTTGQNSMICGLRGFGICRLVDTRRTDLNFDTRRAES